MARGSARWRWPGWRLGPAGATRACVRCGLYLVSEGEARLALLLREGNPRHGMEQATVEVLCADSDRAAAVLGEIRRLALEHSVFRGQILSFGSEMFGPRDTPLTFHERPALTREDLVLPGDVLEAVEAQVVGIARHRSRLVASGQHLKRGVLLHGPPGPGKTRTLRYLLARLTDTTVVMPSGDALWFIAWGESRSPRRCRRRGDRPGGRPDRREPRRAPRSGPAAVSAAQRVRWSGRGRRRDVLLTANRVDLVEPALARRPGLVDQAVEFPLAAAAGLLTADGRWPCTTGNLNVELGDSEPIVAETEGVTAPFFKELLRRAALVSAERTDGDGDGAPGCRRRRAPSGS